VIALQATPGHDLYQEPTTAALRNIPPDGISLTTLKCVNTLSLFNLQVFSLGCWSLASVAFAGAIDECLRARFFDGVERGSAVLLNLLEEGQPATVLLLPAEQLQPTFSR
jgi:hypothetical protein